MYNIIFENADQPYFHKIRNSYLLDHVLFLSILYNFIQWYIFQYESYACGCDSRLIFISRYFLFFCLKLSHQANQPTTIHPQDRVAPHYWFRPFVRLFLFDVWNIYIYCKIHLSCSFPSLHTCLNNNFPSTFSLQQRPNTVLKISWFQTYVQQYLSNITGWCNRLVHVAISL